MASNITVDTLTKGSTTLNTDEIVDTNSNQICKAWVNFDGTGTVAIRDSYNVSSITDNATGHYNANFSTSLGSADYVATGSVVGSDVSQSHAFICGDDSGENKTASSCNFRSVNYLGSIVDNDEIQLLIFGD